MQRDEKEIKDLIHRIGLKHNLPDNVVKQIVESPFLFAKEVTINIDFKEIKTLEDLEKTKTNFYFLRLGKLHIPLLKTKLDIIKRKWTIS